MFPVDVLGDPAKELVVVKRNDVSVYLISDGQYVNVQRLLLPAGDGTSGNRVYFGFGRLAKNSPKSLIVMASGGLLHYPYDGKQISEQPVQFYKGPLAKSESGGSPVQYYDLALDMDNDGVDELLVPEESGFAILRQGNGGAYSKVPLPRNSFKRKDVYQFSNDVVADPTRAPFFSASISHRRGIDDLLFYDANGDKLQDLIYSSTEMTEQSKEVERYDVFLQQKGMTFETKPNQSLAIPYDSTAQSTFRDVNADGKLDAVVVRSNLDIVNPRTLVKFYVGTGSGYQVFNQESDRFVTKDPIGLVQLADFNSDGFTDFAMTFFSYQFGSTEDIIDLALANKIKFKLQFFLGRGASGYNRQPDADKEITLNTKLENFRGNAPVMIVNDMNGDRVRDLIVRTAEDKLDIFCSQGSMQFPAKPSESLTVPSDATTNVEDLNGDGQADLLVSSGPKQILTIYFATGR
ncbi:MAG: FG-GAP repeat domain-containing protein [Candidatus Sumerlaeaceae bacterium]